VNPQTQAQAAVMDVPQVTPQMDEQQITSLLEQAMTRPLAQDHAEFELALRMGEAAFDAHSGLAENTPQAAMKILLGKELGIPSIVALTAINVIKERVSCSGALIAALLRARAKISWSFVQHDKDGCVLAVFQNGKPMMERWLDGEGKWRERQVMVMWTRDNAERAKLTGTRGANEKETNYEKYGEDMYFNRCITRVQRRYAPEISHGIPLYVMEELDDIDALPAGPATPIGLKAPERIASAPATQPKPAVTNGQKVTA
jgi:hypothetical protein